MAFIPVPDSAVCVLEYGDATNKWTNTVWFRKPGFTEADLQTLADEVHEWIGERVIASLWTGWSILQVTAYDMRSVTGPMKVDARLPVAGSEVGDVAPKSLALCITFYTATRGRSGRGRNYIAGWTDQQLSGKSVTDAGAVASITNAYNLAYPHLGGLGWEAVVAQRYEAGAPLPVGVTHQIISAVVRNDLLTHQRRRIPRD